MTTIISIVLIFAALIFVVLPFLRPQEEPETTDVSISPLQRQKRDAYAAIREAEFDLRMGKLSEDDFAVIKEKYRGQALAAIAALEASPGAPGAQQDRTGNRSVPPARPAAFCPNCGQKVAGNAKFCAGCGRSLLDLVA